MIEQGGKLVLSRAHDVPSCWQPMGPLPTRKASMLPPCLAEHREGAQPSEPDRISRWGTSVTVTFCDMLRQPLAETRVVHEPGGPQVPSWASLLLS